MHFNALFYPVWFHELTVIARVVGVADIVNYGTAAAHRASGPLSYFFVQLLLVPSLCGVAVSLLS